ncbi:MAG: L-threonylcarbamoyladenylate synthase [Thermodesulfobacteriota bacterium]
MTQTELISLNDPDCINKSASTLRGGGVIIYPTETLYGVGALASNNNAVENIFEAKGRPVGKPIPLLVKDIDMASKLVRVSPLASILAEQFWPGKLTMILDQIADLPEKITFGSGKIAVRISSHPFMLGLFERFNEPLTSTSANISGGPNLNDPKELFDTFNGKVDLIVDSGKIRESKGSTIVDLTLDPPEILRDGDVDPNTLKEYIDGHS